MSKVFSISEEYVEKEKCSRKNSVAHILFEMGEVEKMSSCEFLEYSQ